jgi:hypothetical protein
MLALASAFEMVVTPYGLIGSSFSNSAKSASNYSLTVSSFIIGTAAVAVTSSGASSSSSSSSSSISSSSGSVVISSSASSTSLASSSSVGKST